MASKTFVSQKELSNLMQDECKYVIQEVVVFRIHKLLKEWDNLQGLVLKLIENLLFKFYYNSKSLYLSRFLKVVV